MGRIIHIILAVSFFIGYSGAVFSQEETKNLILREGKQIRREIVAVEVYRIGDVVQVDAEVRIYAQRPRITDVMIVGSGLGRLSYHKREDIPFSFEENSPYEISRKGGVISTGDKKAVKKPKGTVVNQRFTFDIPWEKVKKNKKYQLWIDIESKNKGGRTRKFKFDLKNLKN